jgi:DNA-binding Lrp family transcriptional regulator
LSEEIAHDIRAFMLAYVSSYEQLELLLLLRREAPAAWPLARVAEALAIPHASAAVSLEELARRGLLRGEGCRGDAAYCFDPADASTTDLVARLARAYDERRVAVIDLMSTNAIDRIRKSALRTFAEAFRVRGPKKDG